MAFTANVACHFVAIGQPYASHLSQSRVRLLWCGRVNTSADTSFLRASFQRGYVAFVSFILARFAYELVDRRHNIPVPVIPDFLPIAGFKGPDKLKGERDNPGRQKGAN
jgi:hypothetical protein